MLRGGRFGCEYVNHILFLWYSFFFSTCNIYKVFGIQLVCKGKVLVLLVDFENDSLSAAVDGIPSCSLMVCPSKFSILKRKAF